MPKKLARNEWDFSKVDEGHEQAAWEWEADRSAFHIGKRWLELSLRDQEKIVEYLRKSLWPVQEHNLEYLTEGYIKSRVQALDSTSINLHLFDVDWAYTKAGIKKSFSEWVDMNYLSDIHLTKRAAPVLKEPGISQKNPKGGRPSSYIGQLMDLAIYRLHNAGISRNRGAADLRQLADRGKIGKTPDNKLSAQHWTSTVGRMNKIITDRKTRNFKLMDIFDVQ